MELGFYGHERLTGSVPTMQTGHFTNQGAAALDQAILRSMRAGNSSMHAILKDAKALLARQQARIDELSRLATTDELTGLLNRRGFIQVFERELDRIGREKRSGLKRQQGGVVVMIDLDNFKTINDMYGIEASDAALKLVAKTLKMDIRKMDVAARLEGDEFISLFMGTSREKALPRIQRLIKTLNNLSFVWDGHEIDIRASVGVKEYAPGDKIGRILSTAHAAVYSDKPRIKDDVSPEGGARA